MFSVLLAVDTDPDRARRQAAAVADLPGHEEVAVTVIHAFGDNPEGASVTQIGSVRRAVEVLEQRGIETHLAETSGDPVDEILGAADDIDADLICVGGRKRSPAGKALFGSVAQGVILSSDRPVMITGASPD